MKIFPLNGALAKLLIPQFIRWGVSANEITACSLLAGLAGAVAFIGGAQQGMIAGALWFFAANLLDECDGAVARANGTSSGWGSWFDTLVGCAVHAAFFASLGYGLSRQTSEARWVLLGALMGVSVVIATAAYIAGQGFFRGKRGWLHPDPPRTDKPGQMERVKGALRTDFSLVVLLASVAGALRWLLWGGLLGTFLFWIPFDFLSAARLRRQGPAGR